MMNPLNNYTEEELVKGCLKNDRKFQEILYRKYAKKMYAVCRSYAHDQAAAQDILQDAFVKIFDKMKEYKSSGSLEGWIRRIVVNTAIDYYRQQVRINKYIEDEKYQKGAFVNETVFTKLNLDEIFGAVGKLPEGARIIFNLFTVEGYTHEEIAQKLQISVGTSKSQLSRAKSLLQEKLLELKY